MCLYYSLVLILWQHGQCTSITCILYYSPAALKKCIMYDETQIFHPPSSRSFHPRMERRRRYLEQHSWLGNQRLASMEELLARSSAPSNARTPLSQEDWSSSPPTRGEANQRLGMWWEPGQVEPTRRQMIQWREWVFRHLRTPPGMYYRDHPPKRDAHHSTRSANLFSESDPPRMP